MGVRIRDLQPHHIEHLRAELAAAIIEHFASPPIIDYQTNSSLQRPISRSMRDEINAFVHSLNLSAYAEVDVTSSEVRRLLEAVLSRYIEANPRLAPLQLAPRVRHMRSRIPAVAAKLHYALQQTAQLRSTATATCAVEVQITARSWGEGVKPLAPHSSVRTLAATPAHHESPPAVDTHATRSGLAYTLADATVPVPSLGHAGTDTLTLPPDLAALYGSAPTLAIEDTGTLPLLPALSVSGPLPGSSQPHHAAPQEYDAGAQSAADAWLNESGTLTAGAAVAPGRTSRVDAADEARRDIQIFGHLRFQMEAFIHRAADGYGVGQPAGTDPYAQLAALRASGMVDAADLSLAEQLLALAARVSEQESATLEDYRQAFLMYLLYHRAQFGG